jgi:hypothetical protein
MQSVPDYLVKHGQGAFLGRFRAAEEVCPTRGQAVVVRSTRGLELGVVLEVVAERFGKQVSTELSGTIVRVATSDDQVISRELQCRADAILVEAQEASSRLGIPLSFLDAELLLDESTAILQGVHWAECDITQLLEELSEKHGLIVRLHDLTAVPQKESSQTGCETCGKEKSGCSSCGTGGGCSTGSCSKGSVKSSQDMTAYFQDLRRQMEASGQVGRVPLH